jgi:hypothetical protein
MTKPLPSIEIVRQLVRHDPESGRIFWRERAPEMFKPTKNKSSFQVCAAWNDRYANKPAFDARSNGYRIGFVSGCRVSAHRVIWALENGRWSCLTIDHINGDPSDNRIANLREATHKENMRNRRSAKNSTSQYIGVTWESSRNKWAARIRVDGRKKRLGMFACEEDAARAYDAGARKYFGDFANPNFK